MSDLTRDQMRVAIAAMRSAEARWQRASEAEQQQMVSREIAVVMAIQAAIDRTTPAQGV